jgi:hypothetical protein
LAKNCFSVGPHWVANAQMSPVLAPPCPPSPAPAWLDPQAAMVRGAIATSIIEKGKRIWLPFVFRDRDRDPALNC